VAETETPADDVTKTEDAPAAEATADVAKAETLLAVYDATGKLIGVVAPDSLTPVDGGEATEDDGDELGDVSADDAVDEAEPVEAAAEDTNEAVIPGTNTIQSPVEDDPEHVTKATTDIAALLKEALAPLAEQVAKAADLAGTVEVLKEQIAAYGREPDDRKSPYLNGATGTAGIAKRDGTETDPHTELRKAVAEAKTQDERIRTQKELSMALLKATLDPSARYAATLERFAD
jgi:hypothetical protein